MLPPKGMNKLFLQNGKRKIILKKTPVIAISQWQRDCMCRSRLISPVVIMAVGAAQPRVISLLLYLLLFFPLPQTVWVEALDGSRCSAPRKDVGVSQWLYVGCYLWQTGVWARASLGFFTQLTAWWKRISTPNVEYPGLRSVHCFKRWRYWSLKSKRTCYCLHFVF